MVLHLAAWKEAVRERIAGVRVVLPADGDFPPVGDLSEAAWSSALELLERSHTGSYEMQWQASPIRGSMSLSSRVWYPST